MEQITANNKDIAVIDVVKFAMAFAVIAIHSRIPGLCGDNAWPKAVEYIISLAVPFFFIASGFLLSYKIDAQKFSIKESRIYVRKRAFVLFRIFICWLLIYLPITAYSYYDTGTSFLTAVAGYLYKVVMSGHSLWSFQLWFVYSMAWVLLLYSFVSISNRNLIAFALLFTIISMANIAFLKYNVSCFRGVYVLTHSMLGGLYLTAGFILYRVKAYRWSTMYCIPIIICSITFFIFDLPFYEIVGGIALVLFALTVPLKSSNFFIIMRRLSMWIFYLHMIAIWSIQISIPISKLSLAQYFLLSSLITLAVAIVIDYVSTHIAALRTLQSLIK